MDTLRVRVYNVRFGDAILVSVPERVDGEETTRHMLIDVGNVLSTAGGDDVVFEPVMRDVLAVLDGAPLDLYVMTHEHLDHVQGLLYASQKLGLQLPSVQRGWLTASAAPDYYDADKHPDARKQFDVAARAYAAADRYLLAQARGEDLPSLVQSLLTNNDGLLGVDSPSQTRDCVDFLRNLAATTSYVHRGADVAQSSPFEEARLEVWAPEEDTSAYYGRFQPDRLQPLALDIAPGERPYVKLPTPPPGVDAGAFYNLVEARSRGYLDNLLMIDKAANNTSVVLCLEWRGWRLLFPGDAEERSWRTMDALGILKPVHFYKVGHHGSHNGTPSPEILEKILPTARADGRERSAVVSTSLGCYHNVPDEATLAELRSRCDVVSSTLDLADGQYLDFEFPDTGA